MTVGRWKAQDLPVFHRFFDISDTRVTQKSVYLCIHKHGPISKNGILEKIGSSLANISRFLVELEDAGMILKTEGRGRISGQYEVNPDAGHAFGGYINHDVIGLGVCDVAGNVHDQYEIPFADADTPEKALAFFSSAHQKLLRSVDADRSLGSSIAILGPMDKNQDLIVNPPDMPKWGVVPFKQMYEDSVGQPVTPVLFAEAILLGAMLFGNYNFDDSMNVFWLDEGIGASVTHKGRMDLDVRDNSMILGHQVVDFNGRPCFCGNRGCLTNYGSIHSFRQNLLPFCRLSKEEEARAEAANSGDPWRFSKDLEKIRLSIATENRSFHVDPFLEDFDKAYFAGLWNTVRVVRPDRVIICGRIASYYRDRLERVVSRIAQSHAEGTDPFEVSWVDLKREDAVRGSAARVFNHYLNFVS